MSSSSHAGAPQNNSLRAALTWRIALLFIGSAILLDVVGFYTVPHRADFSSNSAFYLQMAQHGVGSVPSPFRYRALVPWVAGWLPMSADHAFLLITHISLIGCLFVAMWLCRRAGTSSAACLFAALALFCSRAFTYNYLNPYMTDGPALLAIFIMVLSYLDGDAVGFGLAGLFGILAHEIVVLLVPVILFSRRWRRGTMVCAVCAAVFLATRFWMSAGYGGSLKKESLFFSSHLAHPGEWVKETGLTWYLLWIVLGMGMSILPAKKLQLWLCAALLGGGAFVLSLFVLDTERTYSILAPVVAVAAAVVFDRIWKAHRVRALCLITVPLAEIASAQAMRTGTRNLTLLLVCSVPAMVCLGYVGFYLMRDSGHGLSGGSSEIISPLRSALRR